MAGGVQVFNPETSKVEDVDAEKAYQGFVGGKYHLPARGEVHLSAPDGTTAIFPTGEVPALVQKGWVFSNPKQVAEKTVADSPLRQVQGGVEGALGELTFGGSDLALRGMGVSPADLAARRESTGGQIGKYVGLGASMFGEPGLKLLGEGVAKAGLEHALLPTLGITAAGDAIEAGAKKILGDTITNQAVAHTVASGLGRAAEGTAYGFGGALSEEALGDPEINAQHLLAGAGMGALVGGVAGAGLRGLSEYRAGRVTKAADDAYKAGRAAQGESIGQKGIFGLEAPKMTEAEFQAEQRATTGEALPEKGLKRWFKGYNDQLDKISAVAGYDPEDLKRIGGETGQAWLRKGKQSLDDSARGLKDALNDVVSEQSDISKQYYGALKPKALDLIPKGSDAAVLRNVGDALDRVRGVRDQAVADYARLGFDSPEQASKAFANMDALVDDAESRIFKSAGAGRDVVEKRTVQHPYYDPKVAQEGMENPPVSMSREETTTRKRSLQELADSGHPLPEGLAKKAFENLEEVKRRIAMPANLAGKGEISDVAQRELNTRFKDAWGVLKTHLEDNAVWGKMGDVQKEMNSAFAARQQAFDVIEKAFKIDRNGQVDPGAVHGFVSKIDKMRGDAVIEALDNWHGAQKQYADAIDKHFAGDFGGKSRAAAAKYQAARKELEEGAMTFNALERVIKRRYQNYGGSGLGGGLIGAGLGVVAGPLGVAGGLAGNQLLQGVLDPGRRALNQAALSNAMDKMTPYIDGKVEALMRGKEAVAKAGRAAVGPFGQRQVSRATIEMLQGKTPEERRKAYDDRLAELQHLDDPGQFSEHVGQQLLGLQDTMPKHAQAMTRQAATALQYLRALQPQPTPGTTGAGGPLDALYAKPSPHARDIQKYGEIDKAVQDPLSVLEDAQKKGYVFKHQVDALQAVYPQIMQAIRQAIAAHAGTSDKPPSVAQSRVLSQLLGQPAVQPAQLKRFQAVHQQQAPKPPPPTPPSSAKTARSTQQMTTSDRLETYPL